MSDTAEKIDVIGEMKSAKFALSALYDYAERRARKQWDDDAQAATDEVDARWPKVDEAMKATAEMIALLKKMAAHVRPTCTEIYDEATALLARVDAGS